MERQRYADTLRSVRSAAELYRGTPNTERGLGQDSRQWIETLGWTTSFKSFAELAAGYPRSADVDADSGHIVATRN